MNKFFSSNKPIYRFARTVLQAIVGFLIDNIAMIIAATQFDGTTQALIVAGTMAVCSPIMKMLGREDEAARDENNNIIDEGDDD